MIKGKIVPNIPSKFPYPNSEESWINKRGIDRKHHSYQLTINEWAHTLIILQFKFYQGVSRKIREFQVDATGLQQHSSLPALLVWLHSQRSYKCLVECVQSVI